MSNSVNRAENMSSSQSDLDAVQGDGQAERPTFVLHEGGAGTSLDGDTPSQAEDTVDFNKRGRHAAEAARDSTIAEIRDRYEGLSDKKWWQRRKE